MILFFGTRNGRATQQALNNVRCPHCQQENTLTLVEQGNYFHLFWIKLFKIQTNRFVECSHCKRVYFENEFTSEIKSRLN